MSGVGWFWISAIKYAEACRMRYFRSLRPVSSVGRYAAASQISKTDMTVAANSI